MATPLFHVSLTESECEDESEDLEDAQENAAAIAARQRPPPGFHFPPSPRTPSPSPSTPQDEAPSAAPAALQDEAPSAAPAAPQHEAPAQDEAPAARRMPYAEAVGRLMFMSWNSGAGARKLANVIDSGRYHVVAVQEACEDLLAGLAPDRWSYAIKFDQFSGVRRPASPEPLRQICPEQNPVALRHCALPTEAREQRCARHLEPAPQQ